MMGASKRIMEFFLEVESDKTPVSTARFANIAFSDGSLLHSFLNRLSKKQPVVIPKDIKRYFMTPKEAGILCLMSCLVGENRELFFPKLSDIDMQDFYGIAERFFKMVGFDLYLCQTEQEARSRIDELVNQKRWPCYISDTDTTGEKMYEEFYTQTDDVYLDRFRDIGVLRMRFDIDKDRLEMFLQEIEDIKKRNTWSKDSLIDLFKKLIPDFKHLEKGRYLDDKM